MTKHILRIATAASLLFVACQNTSKTESNDSQKPIIEENKLKDVSFAVAKNYFVNNIVKKIDNPKIETAEKFNQVFGMATTTEGKPTEIDFTKQYVIAVLLPETDLETTINPVSLQKNEKGEMTLTYKTVVGQKQSFTTLPNIVVIVDKAEKGKIILKEIK